MTFLGIIMFIYMLHSTAVASSPILDKSTRVSTEWNQSLLLTMKWIPQPNNHELFYDILTGKSSHSIAILQWNSPIGYHPGGFNLSTISHEFTGDNDRGSQKSCLIPAEEDIESLFPIKIVYLRADRVLIYFRKQHKTKGSLQIPQVINPETCKIEEGIDIEPNVGFSPVSIVPFKNTFDVIFYNQTLCPEDWWCKMTFDHDGKKISGPSSLFKETQNIMYIDRIYPMNYESDKEGYVVVTKRKDFSDKSALYTPIRGWTSVDDLKEDNHFYSNTSGYATICWQDKDLKNIRCTWLDGTHKDKNGVDSITTISLSDRTMQIPYIGNTPAGNIAMLKEGFENGQKVIISDTAGPDGKCKRYLKTEFTNELKRVELTIIDDEKSCISLVTRDPKPVSHKVYSLIYAYKFDTHCVQFSKDFVPENIACGKDYIFA